VSHFPVDLLGYTFEALAAPAHADQLCGSLDMTCLAITCRMLYKIGYEIVNLILRRARSWPGNRLVHILDGVLPHDLPCGRLTTEGLSNFGVILSVTEPEGMAKGADPSEYDT
jgi:hypothetical protein